MGKFLARASLRLHFWSWLPGTQHRFRNRLCDSIPVPGITDPVGLSLISQKAAFDENRRQPVGAQNTIAAMPNAPSEAVHGLNNAGVNERSQIICAPVIVVGFNAIRSFPRAGIVMNRNEDSICSRVLIGDSRSRGQRDKRVV